MKVKIDEQRYCELLNKERLLRSTEAVQHRHCEEYKADAEKWRKHAATIEAYCPNTSLIDVAAWMKDAELGRLVREMPPHSHLIRFTVAEDPPWACHVGMYDASKEPSGQWEHTPELALRSALKETE